MTPSISKQINALLCFAICVILMMAFCIQSYSFELPCPLCLLQRLGFSGIAYGFLLNCWYRPRPLHYTISLISALFTASVGMRQILLHIVPDSGAYGSPIFGLHLYVWSFLISSVSIFMIAILLMSERQFGTSTSIKNKRNRYLASLVVLVMLITLANSISTLRICGINACPDNPVNYLW